MVPRMARARACRIVDLERFSSLLGSSARRGPSATKVEDKTHHPRSQNATGMMFRGVQPAIARY